MSGELTVNVEVEAGSGHHPTVCKRAAGGPEATRLAHEAEVLDAIRGPGVVALLSFEADDDRSELRTAWAGHHTMATIGAVPVVTAAGLMRSIAATVARLHDLQVAHTRLTADHVVISADGRPVLCGFSRASRGDPRSMESDVVALGELLTSLLGGGAGDPMPDHRIHRRRAEPERASLLTLADRATAEGLGARLSAASFAESLRVIVPERATTEHPLAGARRVVPIVAGIAGAVLLLTGVRQVVTDRSRADATKDLPSVPVSAPPLPDVTPTAISTTSLAPPPTSTSPSVTAPTIDCPPVGTPSADVDGDGCPEPYRVDGERLVVHGVTYELGRSGDLAAVGDWDCDGRATPALVRPSTGEVFVFDTWARPAQDVTVRSAVVVTDPTGIRADPSHGPCPQLVVTRDGGTPFVVPVDR